MIILLLWLGIKLSMPPLYFIILLAALIYKLLDYRITQNVIQLYKQEKAIVKEFWVDMREDKEDER